MRKHYGAFALLCLLLLPSVDFAQTRTRRGTTNRRRASSQRARPSATAPSPNLSEARTRVSDQIKNLTRFLYLFGRVSNSIETADAEARRSRVNTAEAVAAQDRSKAALRDNLTGVRQGLETLENYFRTTPGLGLYSLRVAGVSSIAAQAESEAASGQFDQAGRTLLSAVNRLTDALGELR
ncbi:MAG: hypothetical protein H0V27_02205 [Pyrinomonadaceae bacterium]|nr:hypothetical protein [Pyrinomonadaceae bacterium]